VQGRGGEEAIERRDVGGTRPGRETREERRPGRGRVQFERPWQLQRRSPEQGLAVRLGVLRQRRAAVLAQLQGEPRGPGKLQRQAWPR
jgi:hypothetical protein